MFEDRLSKGTLECPPFSFSKRFRMLKGTEFVTCGWYVRPTLFCVHASFDLQIRLSQVLWCELEAIRFVPSSVLGWPFLLHMYLKVVPT